MSIELITILMFCSFLLLIALGLPICFSLGTVGVIAAYFLWGIDGLRIAVVSPYDKAFSFVMVAIPMFVLMANMLEQSGLADALYSTMYAWMGSLKGGLAVGTVIICTLFAAMSGISAAATVTMGLIALPSMFKRGYNKQLVMGSIMAGGALGILIPPSVIMVIYGLLASESVGRLFAGGVIPGLILSALFNLYIIIICKIKPHLGPVLPSQERPNFRKKIILLREVIFPLLLITVVLGSIFSGAASPSEAAAIGALGSIVCAAIYRRLTWKNLGTAVYRTFSTTGMILWIAFGAGTFTSVFQALGAPDLIRGMITALPVTPLMIVFFMMFTYLILGCFLEPLAICLLTVPLYLPIIRALGYDGVWFGVLFTVNMEMSFLTPPVGLNLFYMKAIVPPEITMADIYRSVGPFVALQAIGVTLVVLYPQLVLWLPNLLLGKG